VGFFLIALIVLILDQSSKQFFWNLGQNFEVIGEFARITMVRNSGAAFGMLQGGRVFLIVSSVIASIVILFLAERVPREERAKRIFLGMILGGALGNLVDRIYPGHVIDFIDIGVSAYRWPVFNLADAAVTVGGILLILSFSRTRGSREKIEAQ
jgi:signal peptidase II